ncbi:hypothetical protein [Opitutus terrae]|uniref:PRC-barrel domain protein n=1 Tax=Opitutus terrae (strain DSM 11246 / JCM 15787 / PB90-1) TaxID=452637 RepID=B1ZU54_OPITP|nr:hypothetical protein [Opitutus terrae]ACB76620.1 hypothetical protein Oter_3343 [Opitutus terrae PB90-1]
MKPRNFRFLFTASVTSVMLTSLAVVRGAAPASAQPTPPAPTSTAPEPPQPVALTALPLEKLLWRDVRNPQGKSLGIVNDVLAHMPSGRIIYLSILPARLYGRPKVVPPGVVTVPDDPRAPLQIDITEERWIEAPVIDWNNVMVVKPTDQGAQVYAFYEQSWLEPPPGVDGPVDLSAKVPDPSKAERYVALKPLLLERVTSQKNEQTGYLSGFLIDWPAHRVTHALVSPRFPPVPKPDEQWFAVPLALLTPPNPEETIVVQADTAAFNQAPVVPASDRLPAGDTPRIYRYPAAKAAEVVAAE